MSIGSLGGLSSLAASPATQRSSDVEKTQTAATEKGRVDSAAEYAEQAAGIGETKEESESSDRDADGRKIWEFSEKKRESADEAANPTSAGLAKDPTGNSGGQLDLSG